MKGLLLKDYYALRKYCWPILIIMVVFPLFSLLGNEDSEVSFFSIYPMLFAGMMPVTLFAYDEKENWDRYSRTFPYTISQLVSAKYLIGLIIVGIYLAVSAAVEAVREIHLGGFVPEGYAAMIVVMAAVGLIGPGIALPLAYRFGSEKGRLVYIASIVIFCIIAASLSKTGVQLSIPGKGTPVLLMVAAAAMVIYLVSWALSVVFYKAREI